jgi:hypothetical protein
MFGAAIEKTDPLPDRRVALHFLATFRAPVQLLPAAFRRFVVSHALLRFGGPDRVKRWSDRAQTPIWSPFAPRSL